MTMQDTAKVMAILQAAFPAWARGMSDEDGASVLNLWAMMFADDPAQDVLAAVQALIATQVEGYPPTVGAVKAKMDALRNPNAMTEGEAWKRIYRAICNGIHGSVKEFNALPESLQRIVGSPNQLRDWAVMDADTVNSVVASNVMRAFRTCEAAARETRMLPESLRTAIAGMKIGGELPPARLYSL